MRILMTQVRLTAAGAVLAGAVLLTACASSATQPTAASTTSATPPAATTSAAAPASATASPSPTGDENLTLTDQIRAALVAAAAKLNNLPASAYLGLVKGESYYGYDPASSTYWAGGALDPSPSSQQAQVSVQDDGGYYIFEEPAGGSWVAFSEGMAGIDGATCSVHIPPALVALWHWAAGACHPAGI